MSDQYPVEREIKIPVADHAPLRRRLEALGARCTSGSRRETNTLLDTADGALRRLGEVLRLRRYGDREVLTFKGEARWEGAVKEREELELEVDDLESLERVFARLGFSSWLRYEKERELWVLGGVEVALDETPIGRFVELEGPPAAIARLATALELDPGRAVKASYAGLWLEHRRRHPEAPRDMLFTDRP